MIDEKQLIALLEKEAEGSLVAANFDKSIHGGDSTEYHYTLGWLNGVEHATALVIKLAAAQPQVEGCDSENQHRG